MRKVRNSLVMALIASGMLIGGAGTASAYDDDVQTITQKQSIEQKNFCGNDIAVIWDLDDDRKKDKKKKDDDDNTAKAFGDDDVKCYNIATITANAVNEDEDEFKKDDHEKDHGKKDDHKKDHGKKDDHEKDHGKKDDHKKDDYNN